MSQQTPAAILPTEVRDRTVVGVYKDVVTAEQAAQDGADDATVGHSHDRLPAAFIERAGQRLADARSESRVVGGIRASSCHGVSHMASGSTLCPASSSQYESFGLFQTFPYHHGQAEVGGDNACRLLGSASSC